MRELRRAGAAIALAATLASQAAHLVMRFQQNLADLVIKGDSTLESIFPPKV